MAKRVSGVGDNGLLWLLGGAALLYAFKDKIFPSASAATTTGNTVPPPNISLADGLPLPGFDPNRPGHGDGQKMTYDANSKTANRDWLAYYNMISVDTYRSIPEADAKQVHDYLVSPPRLDRPQSEVDAVIALCNKWQIDTGKGSPWPLFNNKPWW